MLENPFLSIHFVFLNGIVQIFFKNLLIQVLIHRALKLPNEPGTVGGYTAPDHQRAASMFDGLLDLSRLSALTVAYPAPRPSIQTEAIDFRFV
jgi:hypothetical protein